VRFLGALLAFATFASCLGNEAMAEDRFDQAATMIVSSAYSALFFTADPVTSRKIAEAASSRGWKSRTTASGELMVSLGEQPDKSVVSQFMNQVSTIASGKAVSMKVGAITEPPSAAVNTRADQ
jgi:hypothetical protein